MFAKRSRKGFREILQTGKTKHQVESFDCKFSYGYPFKPKMSLNKYFFAQLKLNVLSWYEISPISFWELSGGGGGYGEA